MHAIVNKAFALFIASALASWIAISSNLAARQSQQKPGSPPYDFRSRRFAFYRNSSCAIEWLGDNAYSSWKMRTGSEASIKITSPPNVVQMPDCNGTISDNVHIILEGPAIIAPVSLIREGRDTVAKIAVYDKGMYNVHVELVLQCNDGKPGVPTRQTRRMTEKPLKLEVLAGNKAGWPGRACENFHWKHGRWLECHNTPLPCVRTGWVWVPSDCYIPVMSPGDIINQRPTWIVFAGSSIERGSFLSVVDYVLGPRAANLTNSDYWKCWGWMDLAVGNLRISYLDFRVFYPTIISGDSKGMVPAYLAQAMLAMLGLGRERETGPDLLHLEFPAWYNQIPAHDFAGIIRSWLGSTWAGKFVVSISKTIEVSPRRYTKPKLFEWLENHDESGIDYFDETNMAAAALHDMEYNVSHPHWSRWSFHYHRRCNQGGMHSCSVVCDATAQQILNFALRHQKLTRRGPKTQSTKAGRHQLMTSPMKFCLNCPRSLVPYTIKDWLNHEETVCHDFVPDAM